MSNGKIELCFKVVKKINGEYNSFYARRISPLLNIKYPTFKWVFPKEELLKANYGILCFKSLQVARRLMFQDHNLALFQGYAKNMRVAPDNAFFILDLDYEYEESLEKLINKAQQFYGSYNSESYMCDAIRLVKIIEKNF